MTDSDNLSLSLEISVLDDESNKRIAPVSYFSKYGRIAIWKSTAQTFHNTIKALVRSKLQIARFNVFNHPELYCCSLGRDELGYVDYDNDDLATSPSSLTSFSLSLSDRAVDLGPYEFPSRPAEEAIRKVESEIIDERNFVGFSQFLPLLSSLTTLKLHYYELEFSRAHTRDRPLHDALLREVVRAKTLPSLSHCSLSGVSAPSEVLIQFIKRIRPHSLVMKRVTITKGTLIPGLDYCTSDNATIAELTIEYMREISHDRDLETLYSHSIPPVEPDPLKNGPNSLWRIGKETKHLITYLHAGRVKDSPANRNKRLQKCLEYGFG
jgi:hypothetical protein